MTLDSSNNTVAILYDIENAPFEMLNYTLGKARRFQPCRTIVISDWDERPEQKRWEKLMRRPGFTFRQISRTFFGKNSLDSALCDSAALLYEEGVRKFFIITTDSDFVKIAELLNSNGPSYIIGVGTKQASETLRNAYNEFYVYPPEEPPKKSRAKKETPKDAPREEKAAPKQDKKAKQEKKAEAPKNEEGAKGGKQKGEKKRSGRKEKAEEKATDVKNKKDAAPKGGTAKDAPQSAVPKEVPQEGGQPKERKGTLTVRLPRTLREALEQRMHDEGVSMDELVTYILMRGLK